MPTHRQERQLGRRCGRPQVLQVAVAFGGAYGFKSLDIHVDCGAHLRDIVQECGSAAVAVRGAPELSQEPTAAGSKGKRHRLVALTANRRRKERVVFVAVGGGAADSHGRERAEQHR